MFTLCQNLQPLLALTLAGPSIQGPSIRGEQISIPQLHLARKADIRYRVLCCEDYFAFSRTPLLFRVLVLQDYATRCESSWHHHTL